jgi:hypothetical protein
MSTSSGDKSEYRHLVLGNGGKLIGCQGGGSIVFANYRALFSIKYFSRPQTLPVTINGYGLDQP